MDSTALLLQILAEDKVDHVFTCYIELDGNNKKIECEKNTIEILTNQIVDSDLWQPDTSSSRWSHNVYKFMDWPECNSSEGMMQPPIWLLYAAFAAGGIAQDYDEVEVNIGYVRGDSALQHKDKIEAAWAGISGLTRMDEQPYKLVFPFAGMSKNHIHNRLIKYSENYNEDFVGTTWVCEDPQRFANATGVGFKRCGNCGPCSRDPRFIENKG